MSSPIHLQIKSMYKHFSPKEQAKKFSIQT